MRADRELIDSLGGVAAVAMILNGDRRNVTWWLTRGIPDAKRELLMKMAEQGRAPTKLAYNRWQNRGRKRPPIQET